jgi:hypothetical protein
MIRAMREITGAQEFLHTDPHFVDPRTPARQRTS